MQFGIPIEILWIIFSLGSQLVRTSLEPLGKVSLKSENSAMEIENNLGHT